MYLEQVTCTTPYSHHSTVTSSNRQRHICTECWADCMSYVYLGVVGLGLGVAAGGLRGRAACSRPQIGPRSSSLRCTTECDDKPQ